MLWKWLPDLRNLRVITLNPSGIYAASNFGTVTDCCKQILVARTLAPSLIHSQMNSRGSYSLESGTWWICIVMLTFPLHQPLH